MWVIKKRNWCNKGVRYKDRLWEYFHKKHSMDVWYISWYLRSGEAHEWVSWIGYNLLFYYCLRIYENFPIYLIWHWTWNITLFYYIVFRIYGEDHTHRIVVVDPFSNAFRSGLWSDQVHLRHQQWLSRFNFITILYKTIL